jgi:hypothetical protein
VVLLYLLNPQLARHSFSDGWSIGGCGVCLDAKKRLPEHCGALLGARTTMMQSPIVDIRQRILDGDVTARELATMALERANSSPGKNTYLSIEEADIECQLSTPSPVIGD